MIAFDLGKPCVVEIAELKTGDWVLSDFPESPATVSVLVPDVHDGVALLLLSGPSAFNVYPVDKRYGHTGLQINVPAERLRLRVDAASAVHANHETAYTLGNVIASSYGPTGVVVSSSEGRAPCMAAFDNWLRGSVGSPSFVFTRWALSYVDESGRWVDLVRRDDAEVLLGD